jgi:hypothetical protein
MATLPALVAPFPPFPATQQLLPHTVPDRRRSSPQQGRALEALGHAIEYLVDARLNDLNDSPGDAAAIHLLMVCSRAVFAECEVIRPLHQRIQQALNRRLQDTLNTKIAS